jgi:hypothetical protein
MSRKRRGSREPVSREVEVEIEGRRYQGVYSMSDGMVHVSTPHGSKSAAVHSMPDEVLAKMLLRELVREERQRPDSMFP